MKPFSGKIFEVKVIWCVKQQLEQANKLFSKFFYLPIAVVLNCYFYEIKKPLYCFTKAFESCRGRVRTFTRQLAITQSSVVDPGRTIIADDPALCYVCPVIPTSETRRHVCQIFHHPTIFQSF